MNAKINIIILALALAILLPCAVAAASDISDAGYLAEISISNNGTIAYAVSANFTANTTSLINTGILGENASDAAIRDANGNDVYFMPGYDGNPWITFVEEIGASSSLTHYLYMRDVTGGEYRYFPGSGGMTVSDDSSLELGDNFTLTVKGFIDTTAVGENITQKTGAIRTYISGSGNVTAIIPENHQALQSSYYAIVSGGYTRVGQRIDNYPIGNIECVALYLAKDGSPTGTANVTVRKVVDDSLLGIIGTIDVSTITEFGTFTWYEFNTTPIANNTVQNLRFSIEYSGGGGADKIYAGWKGTDETDGVLSSYIGGWSDSAGSDLTFSIFNSRLKITIPSLSSGEYEIDVKSDSSFFGIGIDASTADFPISDNLTFNAPLHHADLNGATFTTKDANGYTGTVNGATWTSSGYYFDSTDYISHNKTLDSTADFTIGCWVYMEDNMNTGQTCGIFDFRSASLRGIGIDGHYAGWITFKMREPGGNLGECGYLVGFDSWAFVVGTFDYSENQMAFYYNGNYSSGDSGEAAAISSAQYIGGSYPISGNSVYFQGYIGDCFVYNKCLSPSEVDELYDATVWKYDGSSEHFHYQYSGGASVPDNSNDWIFFSGDAVPYMEYAEITVDGIQKGYWGWEYGTTFSDQSGNGNIATPTFRTISSDADVSADMVSLYGIKDTTPPPVGGQEGWTMISEVPAGPDTLFSELDMTFFGAGYIVTFCESTDIPLALVVFSYAFGLAIILGAIAWYISSGGGKKPHGRGSLLAMAATSLLVMVYFVYCGDGVIPAWVLIPFGLEALAFIVWRQTPSPY